MLHGKVVPNAVLFLRNPGMAEQKFTTDENGKVSFHSPKAGRYFALVTLKFETRVPAEEYIMMSSEKNPA